MQGGLIRTIINFFIAGLVMAIFRSPLLMLVMGFFIGFFFVSNFPDQASQMTHFFNSYFFSITQAVKSNILMLVNQYGALAS